MPKVHLHKIQYGVLVWVVLHPVRAVLRFWKYGHSSPASRDGDAPLMHCCIRRGREGGLNAVSMQCCCIRRRGKPQFVERTSMPPLCHQLWCTTPLWKMASKKLFYNIFFSIVHDATSDVCTMIMRCRMTFQSVQSACERITLLREKNSESPAESRQGGGDYVDRIHGMIFGVCGLDPGYDLCAHSRYRYR